MKKKWLTFIIVGLLVVVIVGTASAFAAASPNKTKVCPINNCTQTGAHQHSGKNYRAHSAADQHNYHSMCNVSGCTNMAEHTHQQNHWGNGNGNGHGNGHGSSNHHE